MRLPERKASGWGAIDRDLDDCTAKVEAARGPTPRAIERRARIKSAAARLFADTGFHSTGVAQIATESGTAVAVIYRDFIGKADIIAEVVADNCRDFLASDLLAGHIAADDLGAVRKWLLRLVEPDIDATASKLLAETVAESFRNCRVAALLQEMRSDTVASVLVALEFLAPAARPEQRSAVAGTILTLALGTLQMQIPSFSINRATTDHILLVVEQQIASLAASA